MSRILVCLIAMIGPCWIAKANETDLKKPNILAAYKGFSASLKTQFEKSYKELAIGKREEQAKLGLIDLPNKEEIITQKRGLI